MASIDTDPDITVGYSRLSSNAVWCFFDEIDDVPTLTAIEEQGEAWEALLDGDRLGMAVVDTVEMPFVSRNRRHTDRTTDRRRDRNSGPAPRRVFAPPLSRSQGKSGRYQTRRIHRVPPETGGSPRRAPVVRYAGQRRRGGRPTRHGEQYHRGIFNARFDGVPISR